MRVIDIAGRLQTAGTWDDTAKHEAAAQARLRATRAGLRAMLAGNEQFHVDPMSAPMSAPTSAKRDEQAAFEAWMYRVCPSGDVTAVYEQWLDSTDYAEWCAEQDGAQHDERIGRRVAAIAANGIYFGSGDVGTVIEVDTDGDLMVQFDPSPTVAQSVNPYHFWYVRPENVRFIEADEPAQTAKRVERINANHWQIDGKVYPCDASGWISHTPTADAVCPVPEGVEFEVRRRNSVLNTMGTDNCLWQARWRPVVQS